MDRESSRLCHDEFTTLEVTLGGEKTVGDICDLCPEHIKLGGFSIPSLFSFYIHSGSPLNEWIIGLCYGNMDQMVLEVPAVRPAVTLCLWPSSVV